MSEDRFCVGSAPLAGRFVRIDAGRLLASRRRIRVRRTPLRGLRAGVPNPARLAGFVRADKGQAAVPGRSASLI